MLRCMIMVCNVMNVLMPSLGLYMCGWVPYAIWMDMYMFWDE